MRKASHRLRSRCVITALAAACLLASVANAQSQDSFHAVYSTHAYADGSSKRTAYNVVQTGHAAVESPYYAEPDESVTPDISEVDLTLPNDELAILPAQFVGDNVPSSPTAPSYQPPVVPPPTDPWRPEWLKSGQVTFGYAPATGNDDFGFTTAEARATFKTPLPLLTLMPRFSVMETEADGMPQLFVITGGGAGPPAIHTLPYVPEQFYEASIEARWFQPLSEKWMLDLAVAPGIYTDGDNTSSDSWRVVGRALAFYAWREYLRLAVGAIYLDRDDVNVLPAVGLMAFPSHDARIELMFPRPKFAYRIRQNDCSETWAYLAGEFGGGQWATTDVSGAVPREDILSYRDYRFLFGMEQKNTNGLGWMVEAGFLFNRQIEVRTIPRKFELDSTAIFRVGGTF